MILVKVTVDFITEFYRAFNSAQDGLSLKDSNGEQQLESLKQRTRVHKTSNRPILRSSRFYIWFDAEFHAESFGNNFKTIRHHLELFRLQILVII